MALTLSPVITARRKVYSPGFAYHGVSEKTFGGLIDPILNFDHFQMSEAAFPPHPHAGFSAVTYIFPQSASGFRNRDSLGGDCTIAPGELHWSMAGKGMLHEESPLEPGRVVEGLQIFVNLSAKKKKKAAEVFHLSLSEIPVFNPNPSLQVNVLVGKVGGVESPLKLPEPMTFFDARLKGRMSFSARVLAGSGALLYVISGKLRLTSNEEIAILEENQSIGARSDDKDSEILIEAQDDSQFIFLSAPALDEPILAHGPFVMNTQDELSEAISAYQRGEMGKLEPLP